MSVSTFGNPRIEAYLQLPAAYRSLSRPSSAPDAKAFTLCSCSLELLASISDLWSIWSLLFSISLELLEFLKHWLFRSKKAFILFAFIHLSVKLCVWTALAVQTFYPWLERPISRRVNLIRHDLSLCPLYLFFLLFFALFDFQWPQNRLGFVWCFRIWLAQVDSNHRPRAYQARALTCWAMRQYEIGIWSSKIEQQIEFPPLKYSLTFQGFCFGLFPNLRKTR